MSYESWCNLRVRDCLVLSCSLFTKGRGLTFTSARVFVRAPVDGTRLATHRHRGPHCGEVRAFTPPSTLLPPRVCHRRRDWAVSIGSHMQQDTVISWSPPRPSASPCHCPPQRPGIKKLATICLWIQLPSLSLIQRVVYAPRGDFWCGHVRHHCDGPVQLFQIIGQYLSADLPYFSLCLKKSTASSSCALV